MDVATVAGGTPFPFDALVEVHLGMQAQELVRARPGVRPAGYTGFSEPVGQYQIGYGFAGSYSENQVVPEHSVLRRVTAHAVLKDSLSAVDAWKESIGTITRSTGIQPRCFIVVGGAVSGKSAAWDLSGVKLSVSVFGSYQERGSNNVWTRKPSTLIHAAEQERRLEKVIDRIWTLRPDHIREDVPEACPFVLTSFFRGR